jgi:hypothetical protein
MPNQEFTNLLHGTKARQYLSITLPPRLAVGGQHAPPALFYYSPVLFFSRFCCRRFLTCSSTIILSSDTSP